MTSVRAEPATVGDDLADDVVLLVVVVVVDVAL